MTDNHNHIGQFEEVYYKPLDTLDIVTTAGVERIVYSSTTSGKDGVLYKEIEREITEAVSRYLSDDRNIAAKYVRGNSLFL
jgi:hypothetical protein